MGFSSYTGYGDYTDFEKLRLFIRWKWFQHVEELYENRDTTKPFFLFNVTMQNHSSYDQDTGLWYPQVKLANIKVHIKRTISADQRNELMHSVILYLTSIKSKNLRSFLCMEIISHILKIHSMKKLWVKKLSELTDEEQQKRYIPRFIVMNQTRYS